MRRDQKITRKRKDTTRPRNQTSGPKLTINRSPFLTPERLSVKLQFGATYDIKNVGFRDASYVFRPSSVYDIDPAIGGASCYGLTEYSQFYEKYRVVSSKISLHMSNTDLEGVIVSITPSTSNPGNNMSDVTPFIANPLSKFKSLAGYQGSASGTLTHYCTTQQISGVATTAEDGYSALVTTNPLENWYWVIVLAKAGVSTLTNGISVLVRIETTVHFYDRKTFTTALSAHKGNVSDPASFPPPMPVYMVNPPPITTTPPQSVTQVRPATNAVQEATAFPQKQ